jgi:hypothetical protein
LLVCDYEIEHEQSRANERERVVPAIEEIFFTGFGVERL